MSGTIVIPAASGPAKATYFGKNSNRVPGECHVVVTLPAVECDTATVLQCTHISIAQVPRRYGIILGKPWWTWGGEMGANNRGVVIGIEPVLTRDHESEPGLIGMDLVRLGLERGATAAEALDVITSLLQNHGQGGACRLDKPSVGFDNSFIIADAGEAWVLETAGRHWAARRARGPAVLSSRLTLTTDFERSSYALPQYARLKGWLGEEEEVDFAATFGRRRYALLSGDSRRRERILSELGQVSDKHLHLGLMRLLRQQLKSGSRSGKSGEVAICAGGLFRRNQTAGSMVARVSSRRQDIFFTGTSAPGLSIFKPIHFGQPLEDDPHGRDLSRYQDRSLWWRHEKWVRVLLQGARLEAKYTRERDDLEKQMVLDVAAHKGSQLNPVRKQIQENLLEWEQSWREKVVPRKRSLATLGPTARYWMRRNRRDGIVL